MLWIVSRRIALVGLLILSAGCAAAVVGGAVVAGAWAYDAHEDDGGEITLAYPPERVFNEAVYVAENRGEEVKRSDGAMRVHCKVDETEVVMQIFVVPGNEQVSRLKVTARSVLRGEPELAKDFGIDVQARLQGEGSWQTGR